MKTLKKLTTFIFKDQYGWSYEQIWEEAHRSAIRRADMLGWSEIELQSSKQNSFIQDGFTCYEFDILGIETSGIESNFDSQNHEVDEQFKKTALPPEVSN